VEDRIVSISQSWVRQTIGGKAKALVEFGAKVFISMVDGFTTIERFLRDAYNDGRRCGKPPKDTGLIPFYILKSY